MSSLYELTDKYRQLQAVLEDGDEDYQCSFFKNFP